MSGMFGSLAECTAGVIVLGDFARGLDLILIIVVVVQIVVVPELYPLLK